MGRRRRGPPDWVWMAGLGAVALLGWLATLIFRPEPGLLDHASRLADASAWEPSFGGYFWQDDQSILTFRNGTTGVSAVSVNLGTRAETPLVKLSSDLLLSHGNVSLWRLSRDGRYLLWCTGMPVPPRWTISDMSGRRIRSWPQHPTMISPLWLADSRRWLDDLTSTANSALQPVVRSIDGKVAKGAPIPGPIGWLMGVTPDERAVSLDWTPHDGSPIHLLNWTAYSLSVGTAPAERHSIKMVPFANNIIEAELSPRGDAIACLIGSSYISPLEHLLSLYFPDRFQEHHKVALWVVQRDGTGMRLIGSEEGGAPFGLLWTPDGKRLSFVDNNTLYAVRAE